MLAHRVGSDSFLNSSKSDATPKEITSSRRSRKSSVDRPKKPYPDIPLSSHAGEAWQKVDSLQSPLLWKVLRIVNGILALN